MRAGVLVDERKIEVREVREPSPGPGEVIVESSFAGICGTDLHIYRGEFRSRVRFPAIQGHEFGGTVVALGPGVSGWAPGDRVAVDPILPCRACPACQAGQVNCCHALKLLGVELAGGFGRLVAVPHASLYRLPDGLPMEYAPLVETYALGHHVLARGEVQPGESVALLGAGKLGLSVLDVLCHGASPARTFVTDLLPVRLETALRLGADAAVDVTREDPVARVLDATHGVGVDCVIECVGHYYLPEGHEAPLAQAVRMIRNGGRIVTAGLGEQLTPVHFKTLVLKEGRIIASRVTLGEFARAIHLLGKGLLHPQLLITDRLPLRDVAGAFEKIDREDPSTIKVVLDVAEA